jgi:class 3 adenylate cyclase
MTAKILAVDDEPDLEVLLRQKFRREIREGRLNFAFAQNGVEAIETLEAEPEIDVVLTDINMPRMDGLELLNKLQDLNPVTRAVIVSAYGDMANIRKAMNRGAYDFITKPIDLSDLELTLTKTLDTVQRLKDTVQAIRENNILKMYVDDNVLNFMTNRQFEDRLLLNESIDATVMFIDICNFTAVAEALPADLVVTMLNRLFDQIVPEIIALGGTVDKFIGDAVMVIFRGDHHIDRALEAAIAVRNKLGCVVERAESDGVSPFYVSIGVNAGEVVSGNIGSVSQARLDFTVIGDVVNMAARFQDSAAENQIVISEAIYERIKSSFACERIGSVTLKNMTKPVVLYNVVS